MGNPDIYASKIGDVKDITGQQANTGSIDWQVLQIYIKCSIKKTSSFNV